MNRCIQCGRNIKNAETTSGIEFCKYCGKYEQQLTEKDKEIEYQESMKILAVKNQNQKAIEQLEKVKGILIQNADEIGEEYKEDYFMISLGNVKNIIDQQINELKGE